MNWQLILDIRGEFGENYVLSEKIRVIEFDTDYKLRLLIKDK
jgi:hypothetical protein